MKTMVVCPHCRRVKDRKDLIKIDGNIEEEGNTLFDKLGGFLFQKKEVYRCNDCLND